MLLRDIPSFGALMIWWWRALSYTSLKISDSCSICLRSGDCEGHSI
uniref:Uncharacterized protein n=1 Tax=Anguilla anguilla TaxID=7936 RepID=A0A0E9WI07_ANGAN